LELSALRSDFGVEVRGIGLIDVASSDSVYRATRAALEEHSVLLFRNQDVTDDVQAAFSRAFGPLERVKIGSVGTGTFYSRLHNIAADGTPVPDTHQQALTARANQLWHTDSSFKATRRNPVNNRIALYMASHAFAIEGMSESEAKALLAELIANATRPEFTFLHQWRPGDVVMWDNRATMHRGHPWAHDQARSMVRTTISAVDADGLTELRPGAA
jgi:alpha-ketoglutarate-dependent taurine dioxygenase